VTLAGNVYFADWGGNVYSASISTGKLNWEVNLASPPVNPQTSTPISSTLALANGMVYVSDGIGETMVFALSQTDGHTVWATKLNTTMDAIYASPTVYNGLLYIGVSSAGDESVTNWDGAVFALNALTGSVVWTFTTGIGSAGGAAVWGTAVIDPSLDSIYFGTGNPFGIGNGSVSSTLYSYSIMSLNATTGHLNWYRQIPLGSEDDLDFGSTANLFSVTINSTTYNAVGLGNKNGVYYILDATDGNLLESVQIGTGSDLGGIIGAAGFTYLGPNNPELFVPSRNEQVGGEYGVVKAFTPSNGTVMWQFNTQGELLGSVTIIPGALLFGDVLGNLYAVSTTSGQQLFTMSFSSTIEGGITAAEGYLFVPTSAGVYVLAPP
jgi:polyvinyl alcohol dehydrogenase (cytochrome)